MCFVILTKAHTADRIVSASLTAAAVAVMHNPKTVTKSIAIIQDNTVTEQFSA